MDDGFEVGFDRTVHEELEFVVAQLFEKYDLSQNGDHLFMDNRGEMIWARYGSDGLQDLLIDITDPSDEKRTIASVYRTPEGFMQCITTMPPIDNKTEPLDLSYAKTMHSHEPTMLKYDDMLILDRALKRTSRYYGEPWYEEEPDEAQSSTDFKERLVSIAKSGGRFVLESLDYISPCIAAVVSGNLFFRRER